MVTIPQHGKQQLNDLSAFIIDLEGIQRQVDYWIVQVDECIGHGALAIAELTQVPMRLTYRAFESLCGAVHQTIDGEFIAMQGERELVRLTAIDSSYWEITGSPEFERHMVDTYGTYEAR